MANINRILSEAAPRPMDVATARRLWRKFRHADGWADRYTPLLTPPDGNRRFLKDAAVVPYGRAVARAATAGRILIRVWIYGEDGRVLGYRPELVTLNTCPFSTVSCREGCVSQNGHAALDPKVHAARVT